MGASTRFYSCRSSRWPTVIAAGAALCISCSWTATSWAASSIQVHLASTPTSIPNSYQVRVTVSGLAAGDVVDVQIDNTATNAMEQQFYFTAPKSSCTYTTDTVAFPAHQSLAYNVYVKTPNWSTTVDSVTGIAPFTTTATSPTMLDQAKAYYPVWRRQDVVSSPQGLRVVNTGLQNATVSEGQGYGMLIAALAKDRRTFAGLWRYAKQHLDRNGLMNWEIAPSGAVLGAGSATNGDETMAEALIIAGAEWHSRWYDQAGAAMAHAIYAHDQISHTHLIGPGDGWGARNRTIAPGYIDPYAYSLFEHATGTRQWAAVIQANEAWLVKTGANTSTGLVPDWETIAGRPVVPAGSANPTKTHDYYENAAPFPLWVAQWLKHGGRSTVLPALTKFWLSAPLSDGYTLPGAPLSTGYINMPFVAGIATLLMAAHPASSVAQADYQLMLDQQANTYYGRTLKALALFTLGNPAYPAVTDSWRNPTPVYHRKTRHKTGATFAAGWPSPRECSLSLMRYGF